MTIQTIHRTVTQRELDHARDERIGLDECIVPGCREMASWPCVCDAAYCEKHYLEAMGER